MRIVLLILASLLVWVPVFAQPTAAPCGVVDAIDFPIDQLVRGYDDFSLYRPRFGGNHTGVDIGFDRWGDPVRASARGQVTYSDTEGWDTEKGVVIVEHIFPDGSTAYSLYGHMEQTDSILFPSVGRCVERGDVLGVIGWPSLGRPHLHYEIRDFLPDDGGPGYVTGNPLAEGWYNPLDFTALWRARINPAFVDYATFEVVPGLPPVRLENGQYIIASSSLIAGIAPPNQTLWQIAADGVVSGLAALPGNRVVAHTRSGQVLVLENGRYAAIWTVEGPDYPFLATNERLYFPLVNGGLAAYDTTGTLLWTVPGVETDRITHLEQNGAHLLYGVRAANGTVLRVINADTGEVTKEQTTASSPLVAPLGDSWLVLDGTRLAHLGAETLLATVTPPAGRAAAMTTDFLGNVYLYLGDQDSTLLSFLPDGTPRWRVSYPVAPAFLPPLIRTGGGCLLYTLDVDGMLNVFNPADGSLVNQLQLYAGGTERNMPRARLLRIEDGERLQVAAGFLTTMTLNGQQLGGENATCLLG